MKKDSIYRRFLTEALLREPMSARRLLRLLKQLQKEEPLDTPKPVGEALEDWYHRTGNPRPEPEKSGSSRHGVRLAFGSAALAAACLLILFILKPFRTKDSMMQDAASSESYTAEAESSFETAGAAEEEAKEEPTEEAEEETVTQGEGGMIDMEDAEGTAEEELEDSAENTEQGRESLASLIQSQYTEGEALSFTAVALSEQNEDGYLLFEQNVRIRYDGDSSLYAGRTLSVYCAPGRYTVEADGTVTAEEDSLVIR